MSTTRLLWLISLNKINFRPLKIIKGADILHNVRGGEGSSLLDVPFCGNIGRETAKGSVENGSRNSRRDSPLDAAINDGDPCALKVRVQVAQCGAEFALTMPDIAAMQAVRTAAEIVVVDFYVVWYMMEVFV
jgi:hypothetical protein